MVSRAILTPTIATQIPILSDNYKNSVSFSKRLPKTPLHNTLERVYTAIRS